MLMDKSNRSIAQQRAELARKIEYMRCMNADAYLSERFAFVDEISRGYNESVDIEETNEILKQFTADGDEGKDEEIDRIVDSPTDISFDEMIGIQKGIIDEEIEAFSEGANLDYRRAGKILKKTCLPEIKACKKFIKKKNFNEARRHLKNAKDAYNDAWDEFQKVDIYEDKLSTTALGMLFKMFTEGIVSVLLSIIIPFPISIIVGEVRHYVLIIKTLIETGNSIIHDIKTDDISPKTINIYRNKIRSFYTSAKKAVDNLDKIIDNAEKEANEKRESK